MKTMKTIKPIKTETKNEITDKRKKVLDATLKLILESGVQATSMAKVSKLSGVAVGTIYHHFSSKEAIITELYRCMKLQMIEAIMPSILADKSVKEIFTQSMQRMLDYALENPEAFEFVEAFYMSPIIDDDVRREVESKFKSTIFGYFDELRKEGFVKTTSNEMIFLYLNGSMSSMIRARILGQVDWTEDMTEEYINMVWEGVTKV